MISNDLIVGVGLNRSCKPLPHLLRQTELNLSKFNLFNNECHRVPLKFFPISNNRQSWFAILEKRQADNGWRKTVMKGGDYLQNDLSFITADLISANLSRHELGVARRIEDNIAMAAPARDEKKIPLWCARVSGKGEKK